MSKALSIAQSGRHFNGGNSTIQITNPIERNATGGQALDGLTVNSGNGYVKMGTRGGNGFLMMGDIGNASSDNNWVIQTDDADNFLKFLCTTTETALSDLETMSSESRGTTLGTNNLRAYMKDDGSFVAAHAPRYTSSWYSVTADDQQWSASHGLSPAPTFGMIELAITGSTGARHHIGWPNTSEMSGGSGDDVSSFVYDSTGWRVGIDDDLTYKGLYSSYTDTSRESYTSSGYSFRILLF